MKNDLIRHRREFSRALANHKYEVTPNGVYFPEAKAAVGGIMLTTVNGRDTAVDPNTYTIEGLNSLLTSGIKNGAQPAAFYVAPFSGNVAPATSLTAATFTATQTEFTNYDETSRPEFVDGAVSGGSLNNSASRAEITCSSGGGTVWGAGLISVATKSATTGVLMACVKFASARTLAESDVLAFQYTLTLTPA